VTRAVGADSRIGRKYLKPAVGYGGPCFPRDNKAFAALGRKLGVNCALAEATDQINDHQLNRLLGEVEASVAAGGRVTILGLSYKPHTHVIEESQGVMLAVWLSQSGFAVTVCDPLANGAARAVLDGAVAFAEDAEEAIREADAVVIMTPWPQFSAVRWDVGIAGQAERTVIDPWGVARGATGVRLVRLGTGDSRAGLAETAAEQRLA
jgi:UDPglucose 6-dehydrogenase